MKILEVITRSDAGGAQMVAALLANEFVKNGHEVTLVAGRGDGTIWKWLDSNVKQILCPVLVREISPLNDLRACLIFKKIYNSLKPDIVHLHSSKVGVLGRIVFPSNKTVFTVHGFDRIGYGRKLLERLMQYRCSVVVGVCANDQKNLISAGVHRNVTYVFNGIARPSGIVPKLWDIPSHYKKTVLCIARLEPQKNHKLFFEIANLLPQYAFVWIGNTQTVLKHPDNVYFLGTLPSASQYCQHCDLFCLPSNYEGLPMTIIEAMSYGKPVVSSDVGGVSEIVRNGVNGYTLKNDASAFANKIHYILENKTLYNYMCHNSLDIFEKELTVKSMADGYLKMFSKITNLS